MNLSNYLKQAILDWSLRGNTGNHQPPSAVYLGLMSSNATLSEVQQGILTNEITAYTGNRKQITFGPITIDSEGYATTQNTNTIDFDDMPVTTVKYAIITNSPTKGQGQVLYWVEFSPPKVVANAGDTFRVPAGGITVKIR